MVGVYTDFRPAIDSALVCYVPVVCLRRLDFHAKAADLLSWWVFRSETVLTGRLRRIFFLHSGHNAPPAAFPGGKRRRQLLQVASPQHGRSAAVE